MRFLIPQPWILSLKINNSYTRYEIHAAFEGGATDSALFAGARPLCARCKLLLGVVTSCCCSPHIRLTSSPPAPHVPHPPPFWNLSNRNGRRRRKKRSIWPSWGRRRRRHFKRWIKVVCWGEKRFRGTSLALQGVQQFAENVLRGNFQVAGWTAFCFSF